MRILSLLLRSFIVPGLCLGLAVCPASAKPAAKGKAKRSSSAPAKSSSKKKRTVAPAPPRPFSAVIIDPGHGGYDVGGIPGQKVQEKVVALDVAKRLRSILNRAGFRTIMTRSDDTFVSLGQRVAIAQANPDAIFVSIHFNAAFREGARGVETFYASSTSRPVAENIQAQLVAMRKTDNRGVKHAEFYVLRQNRLRAALTECGFLTNPDDTALAQKSSYRQQLADRIGAAIVQYRRTLSSRD